MGRGWTQPGGRPHAETEALRRAGALARGATAYVTLEPCAHHGKTPPCADALIAAGVIRVVSAVEDPDPRVQGRGTARLEAAGVALTRGVCEAEAHLLNAGFFLRIREGRPLLTLKAATSLDGRIATASGESRWITGPEAREWGHRLRARHDAILIGIGTAEADNPMLTCRLPGLERRSLQRVVVDSMLRLKIDSQLIESARKYPTLVVTGSRPDEALKAALERKGARVASVDCGTDGRPEPLAIMRTLAGLGLTRVLLEGGGTIAAAFFRAGIVDRVAWFHAPLVLGAEGVPALGSLDYPDLAGAPHLSRLTARTAGPDAIQMFEIKRKD